VRALVVILAVGCGAAAPRISDPTDPRGGAIDVELHDRTEGDTATESSLGPDPDPPRSKSGPRRGPGCRCRRLRCLAIRSPATTPSRCSVAESGIKECFDDAKFHGVAFAVITTDDKGVATKVDVSAAPALAKCITDTIAGDSFPERPSATFELRYEVPQ
jgi:hypothetical protein